MLRHVRAVDRAEEISATAVRVLNNDDGTWGTDLWGTWFPCDGDTQEDVTIIASDIRARLAEALRAYAEEARREEREACVATAESQCRAIIYRGERRGGSLCGRCCACLASAAIRARGEAGGCVRIPAGMLSVERARREAAEARVVRLEEEIRRRAWWTLWRMP